MSAWNRLASWYACEFLERQTDPFVRFHYEGCLGCHVRVAALARMYPEDPHVAWLNSFMGEAS